MALLWAGAMRHSLWWGWWFRAWVVEPTAYCPPSASSWLSDFSGPLLPPWTSHPGVGLTKYHRPGSLNNRSVFFLILLEVRSPKSRCWQGSSSSKASLLGLQVADFSFGSSLGLPSCFPPCPNFLFLQRHKSCWIRVHPNDLI